MIYVYILFILLGITVAMALIYGAVLLIFSKKKKQTKKDIIMSYINSAKSVDGKNISPCEGCELKCNDFVDKYLEGKVDITSCPTIDAFEKDAIERVSGKRRPVDIEKVAFVFCKGGYRAKKSFKYNGIDTCLCQSKMYEGENFCKSACLGCMDCAKVCPTSAISKNRYGVAEIDRTRCIACGECVKICPMHVIKLIPLTQEVAVVCNINSSKLGEDVNKICSVGCTSCKACINICPTNAISIKNGIVEIDDDKCIKCFECIYVCPNKTISRLNKD